MVQCLIYDLLICFIWSTYKKEGRGVVTCVKQWEFFSIGKKLTKNQMYGTNTIIHIYLVRYAYNVTITYLVKFYEWLNFFKKNNMYKVLILIDKTLIKQHIILFPLNEKGNSLMKASTSFAQKNTVHQAS